MTPWTVAYKAPLSVEFSSQEYWCGLPFPSPGVDLKEAEDIKKRWQEYTEELYKKDLHDPDNHNGLITHLESVILTVKSSGPQEVSLQTKLVEVMEFQLSSFKS